MDSQHDPATDRQLRGWKEIAAWLGRDESTAKRWAASRGLPVYRIPGKGRASVYAWSNEIATWVTGQDSPPRNDRPPNDRPLSETLPAQITLPEGGSAIQRGWRPKWIAAAILVAGFGLAVGVPWTLAIMRTELPAPRRDYRPSDKVQSLYLDASYLYEKRTKESLGLAATNLEQAVDLDPKFAAAHAMLAIIYDLMVEYRLIEPEDGYAKAEAAARAALDIDPGQAEAHAVLGDIAFFQGHDYRRGLEHFARSVAINPDNALSRHWYAAALLCAGRYREALVEIGEAQRVDPASRSILVSKGMILLATGDADGAGDVLGRLVANEPSYRNPYRFLSFVALARNDHQAYLAALKTLFELAQNPAGQRIAEAGQRGYDEDGAVAMAKSMATAAKQDHEAIEPYFLAHWFALAGDFDGAATQLAAVKTRHAFYYGFDPAFAAARADSAFLQRIKQIGLPVIR